MGEITVSVVGSKNPNWFDTVRRVFDGLVLLRVRLVLQFAQTARSAGEESARRAERHRGSPQAQIASSQWLTDSCRATSGRGSLPLLTEKLLPIRYSQG